MNYLKIHGILTISIILLLFFANGQATWCIYHNMFMYFG
ncbi:hypothetical protein KKC1_07260 [Calderihabitans maritimus]|uniref:Uncharacterized protein n=1 Tax=Calderihabitans maritimus TaxID=1246530 RepID=A0A1Z5HQH8_9FIRM|nr:hypothetical protein KKC1_07260 [Calderihabitans maritimus]